MGCGGVLSFLVRTAVGPFTVAQAVTLDELTPAALLPLDTPLKGRPAAVASPPAVPAVQNGRPVSPGAWEWLRRGPGAEVALYDREGRLRAVGRVRPDGWFVPQKVFHPGRE